VLASQGVFSQGALQSKWLKKAAFLQCAKAIGLFDKIDWHVSTSFEQSDVLRSACGRLCRPADMFVARDLSSVKIRDTSNNTKTEGRLRAVFVSRVSPKKNLCGAIQILRRVRSTVEFDVYGPIEDHHYWAECQKEIGKLPSNVTVAYRGSIVNSQVAQVMSEYDLFFLPTLGENFGHVILEALAAGCPVLISDQTAFRNLSQSNAGWDLPIDDDASFAAAIEHVSAMTPIEWQHWSDAAREFGDSVLRDPESTSEYRRMLRLQAA
jgi:glycosyltransferase involved in cell wall biosynthesis